MLQIYNIYEFAHSDDLNLSCMALNVYHTSVTNVCCDLQAKLVQTVVANYVLWPAAHYINFKFVPTQVCMLLPFPLSILFFPLSIHAILGFMTCVSDCLKHWKWSVMSHGGHRILKCTV